MQQVSQQKVRQKHIDDLLKSAEAKRSAGRICSDEARTISHLEELTASCEETLQDNLDVPSCTDLQQGVHGSQEQCVQL